MTARAFVTALISSALLVACGGASHRQMRHTARAPTTRRDAAATGRTAGPPPPRALVTAERTNRLLVVDVVSGQVARRLPMASGPEDVAANAGACETVVVVSPTAGKVTVLDGETLHPRGVLGGFEAPHIPEIAPGGNYAYVTDDARGTVTAIYLGDARVTGAVAVGAGAHHFSFDPLHPRAWVALGESARTIVVLDTANLARPRVTGRFEPGFAVHDLAFSPAGDRVWATAADGADVAVLDARDHRVLFRVPVGPAPQHVALAGRYAYLTSGYGRTIEQVDARTGGILARARSPYGSFELSADNRYVVTSSLLRGTLAIYTPQLKLLRVVHLAPATREVALSPPA